MVCFHEVRCSCPFTAQCAKPRCALHSLQSPFALSPRQEDRSRSLPACTKLSLILHGAAAQHHPAPCSRATAEGPACPALVPKLWQGCAACWVGADQAVPGVISVSGLAEGSPKLSESHSLLSGTEPLLPLPAATAGLAQASALPLGCAWGHLFDLLCCSSPAGDIIAKRISH